MQEASGHIHGRNWLAVCAIAALLGASSIVTQVRASSTTTLSVQSGHSLTINAEGLSRIAVGDGRIAGVVAVGTSAVIINGKSPGHTTVLIWAGGHRSSYEVTVTEQQLDDIARMLQSTIAEPGVEVISFGNSIVMRGTVADESRFVTLSDMVSRFERILAAGHYTVVNAVTVAHPLGSIQQEINAMPGAGGVRIDPDGKGNVVISGTVHDAALEQAVIQKARGLAGRFLSADGKVIDRLVSETTSQVDVKVYVLEIDRTFLNQLGLRLQGGQITSFQNGILNYTVVPPLFLGLEDPSVATQAGKAISVGKFTRQTLLAPTLDLLLQEGRARILSSPNLVTLPGQAAKFLVGGEIPIPISQGLGQVTIIYKEFGVKLDVTPTLLGNGSVETKIAPEVSDLDFQDGITLNGFTVPALKTSKLSTDVITKPGESIIMGGLLRRVEQKNLDKIPILGDLPILGPLFRSTRYQKQDTDIIFVMTPTIITR
jgi:Flp pilus assembly secretin CpaC